MFGYLGGGPLPFEETQPGASFVLEQFPIILSHAVALGWVRPLVDKI